MAGEIQVSFVSAKTVYGLIRDRTGAIWNGSAFVAYATVNYALYVISLVEQGTASGLYAGTFPATIPAGVYNLVAKQQVGGSPAETDFVVAMGEEQWNGTAIFPLSDLITSGSAIQVRLVKGNMVQNFGVYFKSSADHVTPLVSGVVSGQIARDGGSFGALQSGAFTETGQGFYNTNLTSGDLNAGTCKLLFTAVGISGGVADPVPMIFVMQRGSG